MTLSVPVTTNDPPVTPIASSTVYSKRGDELTNVARDVNSNPGKESFHSSPIFQLSCVVCTLTQGQTPPRESGAAPGVERDPKVGSTPLVIVEEVQEGRPQTEGVCEEAVES